jgi:hypothetical protein
MNIVVVTNFMKGRHRFIRDASDWVRSHPVNKALYRVGPGDIVWIGLNSIKFVNSDVSLLGCRSIDIVYYYGDYIDSDIRVNLECRVVPDGKVFMSFGLFMMYVFRKAEAEAAIAEKKVLNDIYGVKAVNYPEDFIANLKETIKKANNPYGLSCHNEAYGIEIDRLNSEILRQYGLSAELCKPNVVACIKEETTMNCDIRSNIKDVIFSDRVTIVLWKDGTKTMVRAGKHENYDPEKGFAMAVCKKMFGNEGNYYEVFKKYVPVTYYIADKKDIMVTDRAVSDEVKKEIVGMIDECRGQNKIWPGLTRKKWKELVNKVAKRVADKRKKDAAKEKCEQKKEGIRSGKYHFGIDLSNYMTPPEEGANSSGKEE